MIYIPNLYIYLLLLGGLISIIFLQNSRSIFVRSIGLLVIFLTIAFHKIQLGFNNEDILSWILIVLFSVSGFLADFYSATLRTWFYSVSSRTMRITYYGIMLGLLFLPRAFGMGIASSLIVGTMIGALIGELSTQTVHTRSVSRATKSVFGVLIGLYGMGIKVLIGLMLIDLIV